MYFDSRFYLTSLFLLPQARARNKANPRPMDMENFGSFEHSEEEEAIPTTTVKVQPKIHEEPSPSNVVSGVLNVLAPREEVAESDQVVGMNPVKPQLLLLKVMRERSSQ